MISINATLVVQVIQFLILMFILNRIMLKPILRIINERSEHISTSKDGIENLESEVMRLKEEYSLKENSARKNAALERSQLLSDGLKEAEEFINDSRKEVALLRETAEKKAENELNISRPLLNDEAVELAGEIIEKVIGRRIPG